MFTFVSKLRFIVLFSIITMFSITAYASPKADDYEGADVEKNKTVIGYIYDDGKGISLHIVENKNIIRDRYGEVKNIAAAMGGNRLQILKICPNGSRCEITCDLTGALIDEIHTIKKLP